MGRCCINQKYSLIINYLQFDAPLLKLLLINNLAVFMQQRLFMEYYSVSRLREIQAPLHPLLI